MWEAVVRADRSLRVGATPELAWSLLRSPQAWSVRPRSCVTFDLSDPLRPADDPAATAPGPLRFYLAQGGDRAYAAVLQLTADEPGRLVSLQTQDGRATWALSVEDGRRGPVLRIAATWTVGRPAKIEADTLLHQDVKGWLARLRDITEGRRAWPGDAMPEPLRQACLASPPPGPVTEAAASAHIDVAPETVQLLLGRPDFLRHVQPAGVAYTAHVPGTPGQGVVGTMQSYVVRGGNGMLWAVVSMLAAASPGARFYRLVTAPFYETTCRYEPQGDGTRLEVSRRCTGRCVAGADRHADRHAAGVAAVAEGYKGTLERLARTPGEPDP